MGRGDNGKDLFLIDTRCQLNKTIPKMFEANGYNVKVSLKIAKVQGLGLYEYLEIN